MQGTQSCEPVLTGNEERAAAAENGDGGDDHLAREAREIGASSANDHATSHAMAGGGRNGSGHVAVARRPARVSLARRGKAHVLNLRDNAGCFL